MKVLLAIAYTKFVETECWQSVISLIRPQGLFVEIRTYARYSIAQARNAMVKDALSGGFDFIFMIDSDQILPPDALTRLLAVDADMRCGWTMMNAGRPETNAAVYDAGKKHFSFHTAETMPKEVFESDGGGLAVALIKTELFTEMEYPYFRFIEYGNGDILTEDLNFCLAVKGMGKSIKVDPSLRAGHIKHIVI
jgi:cellulose synthase/poly-beta-1,6-N-acetylglucosamine synthase-like glycosyltransferase